MLKVILVFSLIFTLNFSWAQNEQQEYVDIGAKVIQELDKNILAVSFKNTKGWHTYWKNPGDAGQAIKLNFSVNGKDIKLKELPWPAPKRYIEQGNMWAYGYSGSYAHFFEIDKSLADKKIKIFGTWLVCKDICIPGSKTIEIKINNNLMGETNSLLGDTELTEIYNDLPKIVKSSPIKFYLLKGEKDNQLALSYIIENADFDQISKKHNIVTPYLAFPFDYKHEEIYFDKKNKMIYGRFLIDWDGIFEDPVWPLPESGLFKKAIATKFLVRYPANAPTIYEQNFKEYSLKGIKQLNETFAGLKKFGDKTEKTTTKKPKSNENILKYLLFAFLGGLILNLMPCVLPVISLKLFGLIIHSDESKKEIFKHNLFYTFGVLFSFIVLATVVFGLKSAGEQIGWGFQLQSPLFVFIMIMLIFIMALNMLGLFEFVTPGGKTLGNAQMKKGVAGDFVNGVLATILSTPCSAPFLGSALPFAFTSSTLNIYLVFTSVGLGLAFPFILTGFFPSVVKVLPKPGAWMDKLKKLLGLSLLLTVVWLYDVLGSIMDLDSLGVYVNGILTLTFFAFYFRKHISKSLFLNLVFFFLPLGLFGYMHSMESFKIEPQKAVKATTKSSNGLKWHPWNPEKMKAAKNSGEYTFINFTASWCLTCKVNKKLVLNSDAFKELVTKEKIYLLEGDWSKRDDNITQFLRKHNIVGVPAYFLIKPDGSVISLGETISVSKVNENL